MFVTIILTLLAFCTLAEVFIHRALLRTSSHRRRVVYYTATAICTLPYLTIFTLGRIVDLHSPAVAIISSIGIVLLLINITWKTLVTLGIIIGGLTRKRWVVILSISLAAATTLTIFYGTLWERYQLRTTHVEIAFERLPEGADGLRVVQFGDLHIGLTPRKHLLLERLATEVERLQPDLVIDCGDMINTRHSEVDSLSVEILSRITAPLGVYTVMGNHDLGIYVRDTLSLPREENRRLLRERQREMGWHNITDSTAVIPVGGDTLYLTAIGYPKGLKRGSHGVDANEDYTHLFEGLPEEAFNMVIAHSPAMWDDVLNATNAELTLSGHVHSMQLKLPIGERGWSPAALVYDHWSGLYRKGDAAINITDGVGSSLPVRVGVKPEIVVITLKKCRNSQF